MNIYEIRKLATKTKEIPPQKVLTCGLCSSQEDLHLYNYPDPYDMGWGYNPQLFCEKCNVQETPTMQHRGRYNPIFHNTYLRVGGIEYKKLQSGGPFICYDCHQISGLDEKTEWRGYSHLYVNGEVAMIEFCMDCWTANHLIDSSIIDCLVYTKGSDWYVDLNKYMGSTESRLDMSSPESTKYDVEYARYLGESYKFISTLQIMIDEYYQSKYKTPLDGPHYKVIRDIYQKLKDQTENLPEKCFPNGQFELVNKYIRLFIKNICVY